MVTVILKHKQLEMRRIFFLCLFVSILVSTSAAQDQNYETVTRQGQTYYKYKVKTGEGLYAVSRLFGVPVDEIKKANPGSDAGLRNGQELLVPKASGEIVSISSSPSNQQPPVLQSRSFKHTVSRGETLFSISQMYNTTVDQIKRMNIGLTDNISEGQTIEIPQSQQRSIVAEESFKFHTILAKETLYSVSKAYSVKPEDIVAVNPGLSVETFRIGQTIRIPTVQTIVQPQMKTENVVHKVKKGETLFSIAQAYGVKVSDIEERNGITASQLKRNMELIVPVQVQVAEDSSRAMEIDADRLLSQIHAEKRTDVIRVGLLLPFLDQTDNQHLRLQEYYEGFLLAVNKMKAAGANIDVFVFETGTKAKLQSLLGTMEMESLHLLIGGMTDDQIRILSDFSAKRKIKYVVPFSSRNNEVLNNSNIFQVNTPHSYLYSKASDVFMKTFRNKNIVIVNVPGKTDKDEFISTLKIDLQKSNVRYSEVSLTSDLSKDLLPLLQNDNVIVPTSGDSGPLNEIISALAEVHQEREGITTNLFGYPEWQTFDSHLTRLMHSFGTYFYSSFFVDERDRETQQFMTDFKKWYGRDLIKTHPKYGLFGYDTGLFFLNAIYRYGINFEERMDRVPSPSLQFAFNFERVNNWSGFINTGLFLIHYDQNNAMYKLNKSR